jgi:hypothetical protein
MPLITMTSNSRNFQSGVEDPAPRLIGRNEQDFLTGAEGEPITPEQGIHLPLGDTLPDIEMRTITRRSPPPYGSDNTFTQLLRLDSRFKPGLTCRELKTLFARCSLCGLVMTRRIFLWHTCAKPVAREVDLDIVDLTMDD